MSRYTNYEMKNNVFGTLSAPISSLATTIQLSDGQGARFTADMLGTLETIEAGKVTKREIVKITNVSGDTLTVVRKYAPCPSSDDANTQGQVSYSFSADDTISVFITKEHFDILKAAINDIYENGLDKLRVDVVSGLQIKVGAGPVLVGSSYYEFAGDTITLTNNATNYVEIDEDGLLVNNTTGWTLENSKIAKVLTSGGAITTIYDRRLGTVGGKIGGTDIHELTEKASLSPDDEFIIADSENIYQNKKIKARGLLGIGNIVAGEDIDKGDYLFSEGMGNVDGFDGIGYNTNVQKLAIQIIGNGENFDNIKLYLAKVGTPTNDLSIRIETDNNGDPSGTLINANATGTVAPGDLTTTLAQTAITFGGTINIPTGEVCFIVLDFGAYDSANYYQIGGTAKNSTLFKSKQYDGSVWSDWTEYNNGFDIMNATNLNKTYRFGSNNYNIDWLVISDDGKAILVWAINYSNVRKFTLGTAWDITTATYSGQYINVGAAVYGVYLRKDGKQITVLDTNRTIHGYNLTTPFDLSTATQYGTYNLGGNTQTEGFTMSHDGLHMYAGVYQTTKQWDLSTAWDITTATATAKSIGVGQIYAISFSEDGLVVVFGMNNGAVSKYTLSTAWDISTAGNGQTLSITCRGATVSKNGLYMFLSRAGEYIDTYSVGESFGEKTQKNLDCDGIELALIGKASAVEPNVLPIIPMSAIADFKTGEKVTYNVLYDINKTNLVVGQQYYLSDTPGEISNSPGTNEFEVGIAIEPTILKLKQTY